MEHEHLEDELSQEQLERLGVEEYTETHGVAESVFIPFVNNVEESYLHVDGNATIRGTLDVGGNDVLSSIQVLDNEVEIMKISINIMEQKIAELEARLQEKDNEQDVS